MNKKIAKVEEKGKVETRKECPRMLIKRIALRPHASGKKVLLVEGHQAELKNVNSFIRTQNNVKADFIRLNSRLTLKTPCKSRCGEVLARLHKFFESVLPFESYLKQEIFLYKPLL